MKLALNQMLMGSLRLKITTLKLGNLIFLDLAMAVRKHIEHAGLYKKGHKPAPNCGRPKISDGETLLSREIFSVEMLSTFIEVLKMPLGNFYKEEQNDKQPAYRALMVSTINNGIQNGDLKVLEHVQNRIMGKIKEVVQVQTDKPSDEQQYAEMKAELQMLIAQGLQ